VKSFISFNIFHHENHIGFMVMARLFAVIKSKEWDNLPDVFFGNYGGIAKERVIEIMLRIHNLHALQWIENPP
jgi:hypothetical protein